MKSYALGIWICLSAGIGIPETDATEIHGSSGEHVNISCSHTWASNNIKYFCRDPCGDGDILVKSDQSPKGRYTLKDYGTGTFTVTIIDLQESDSGIYWCGVDRSVKDTHHKVNLTVSKGGNWDNQSTITMSSFSTPPSPDGIITNTSSATEFQSPVVSSKPAVYESTTPGYLMFTAVTLFVTVIIFGLVLCIWNMRIKKSHSSKVDAEIQGTTCPIETAGDYEEVTNFTIYSTVNKSPAANQIQDPPLYSTITI